MVESAKRYDGVVRIFVFLNTQTFKFLMIVSDHHTLVVVHLTGRVHLPFRIMPQVLWILG